MDGSRKVDSEGTQPPAARRRDAGAGAWAPLKPRTRSFARLMFHGHLWLGILVTGLVLVLSVSGILLNHKKTLGLMPEVANDAAGALEDGLPLADLMERAGAVAPQAAAAGVNRMDVRPGKGLIKVRFRDNDVTEVTLDLVSGRVLEVGERNDVFLEKLHTGEVFGDDWVLLSDFAAVVLVLLLASGYWLWLFPRTRL